METYSAPKPIAQNTRNTLKPIFRDKAELTAHYSLTEKIQDALSGSRFLIVLCSPAAKKSRWVNEEIHLFRKLHGDASILCALVEGTPQTAFPPALLEGDSEPLAANLSGKESFKLGVTQIAASMLGVGLDALIQRDQKRRRRRSQMITLTAFSFSTLMGLTAFTAVQARKEADISRGEAESLVEYMITDLKAKLEPVGRLDVLDGIGDRAIEYYQAQDIANLSDESLARQARARHILGQAALDSGRDEDAAREVLAAHALTKEILTRNPDDTDVIFAHAQSEYWVGWHYYLWQDYDAAQAYFQAYNDLGQRLYKSDPTHIEWINEAGSGANNLGMVFKQVENFSAAEEKYKTALSYSKKAEDISPNDLDVQLNIANRYAGLAIVNQKQGKLEDALSYSLKEIAIYENALEQNPMNYTLKFLRAQTQYSMLHSHLISDSDIYQEIFEDVKITLYDLTVHDPDNQYWAETRQAFEGFAEKHIKSSK